MWRLNVNSSIRTTLSLVSLSCCIPFIKTQTRDTVIWERLPVRKWCSLNNFIQVAMITRIYLVWDNLDKIFFQISLSNTYFIVNWFQNLNCPILWILRCSLEPQELLETKQHHYLVERKARVAENDHYKLRTKPRKLQQDFSKRKQRLWIVEAFKGIPGNLDWGWEYLRFEIRKTIIRIDKSWQNVKLCSWYFYISTLTFDREKIYKHTVWLIRLSGYVLEIKTNSRKKISVLSINTHLLVTM